jgi:hypothetical protein
LKFTGEMAERFKAAVLKTVERKLRGFESLSLRHKIQFRVQSSEFNVEESENIFTLNLEL